MILALDFPSDPRLVRNQIHDSRKTNDYNTPLLSVLSKRFIKVARLVSLLR